MNEPRDLVELLEKNPVVPKGDGEILSGYGVMSCPFTSGDVLCSRRFPASPFGPAYTSIWHRDPSGTWHFYQDVPPQQGCARYFSKALATVAVMPIETHWDGPRLLRIVAPGRIDWQFSLSSTIATRALNLIGSVTPPALRKSPMFLRAMGALASTALGAGNMRLTGRVPNGQRFVAIPRLTWTVPSASAIIDGRYVDEVAPLREQSKLGDFWIPRTGLFAIGRSVFDAFDPSIHYAASTVYPATDSSIEFTDDPVLHSS
jgi:hypothetical protein